MRRRDHFDVSMLDATTSMRRRDHFDVSMLDATTSMRRRDHFDATTSLLLSRRGNLEL